MKYLVAQKTGFVFPILFPDTLTHSSIAAGLAKEHATVRSAGFFSVVVGKNSLGAPAVRVCTHDHSSSLNLSPHPDDATLIKDWLQYADSFSLGSQLLAASVAAEPGSAGLQPAVSQASSLQIDPNDHVFTPTIFSPEKNSAPSADSV